MPDIKFSETPGCRERHLQRRYQNVLFPPERREVSMEELNEARYLDQLEIRQFTQDFQKLVADSAALEGRVDTEIILDLKSRIERLYHTCAGLGGDWQSHKTALNRLNQVIVKSLRSNAGNDPLALRELDRESAARQQHIALLEHCVVADLLRDDSPILGEELVPVLLSEAAETVTAVKVVFEAQQLAAIKDQAAALLTSLRGDAPPRAQAAYQVL